MKVRWGRGRAGGQGRAKGPGRGQSIAKEPGRKLFRRRREWPADHGQSDTRAALWLPLLDTEVLAVEIHRSWHYLYPDADER